MYPFDLRAFARGQQTGSGIGISNSRWKQAARS